MNRRLIQELVFLATIATPLAVVLMLAGLLLVGVP